jgi:hypothetical protein
MVNKIDDDGALKLEDRVVGKFLYSVQEIAVLPMNGDTGRIRIELADAVWKRDVGSVLSAVALDMTREDAVALAEFVFKEATR